MLVRVSESLVVWKYGCENGHQFDAAQVPESSYGLFILRTTTGRERWLNSVEDPVFEEVSQLTRRELAGRSIPDHLLAAVVHAAFAAACDLAEDGSGLVFGGKPACPQCGTTQLRWRESTEPPEPSFKNIEPVTHVWWDNLSADDREAQIRAAIDRVLSNSR